MDIDELWTKATEEKHLVWEVRVTLLLAVVFSYFVMPFHITYLLAIAEIMFLVASRNTNDDDEAHSS